MSQNTGKQTRKSFIEDLRKEESAGTFFNFFKRPVQHPKLMVIGLLFYVGVLAIIFLSQTYPLKLREGVPVRRNIISRVDFSYEDQKKTEEKKESLRRNVPPVLNVDEEKYGEKLATELDGDIRSLIPEIIDKKTLSAVDDSVKSKWFIEEKKTLSEDDFLHLKKELEYAKGLNEERASTRIKIYDSFKVFVVNLSKKYWIHPNLYVELDLSYDSDSVRFFKADSPESRSNLLVYKDKEEELNPAKAEIEKLLESSYNDSMQNPLFHFHEDKERIKNILVKLFVHRIGVNVQLNKEETVKAQKVVASVVKKTYEFPKDKMIVRRGMIPTDIQSAQVLEEMVTYKKMPEYKVGQMYRMGGRALIFTFFYIIFLTILTERKSSITSNQGRFFSFSVLTSLVVFSAFWMEFKGWSSLCIPFLFVAEVFQIAYKRRDSFLAIIFMGVTLTLVVEVSCIALVMTLGALIALYCSKNIKNRLTLLFSGVVGGFTMAVVDLAFVVPWMPKNSTVEYAAYFSDSGVALLNGVATGMLITVILPFIEKIFRITTPLTWLELGNMNHPALKRIAMHSPGTWQHSLMLSALSEAASDAIGRDGLMSRVVCYYHDLGKSLKPQYYIENQQGGGENNPHDRLTPAMSALIIHSHPKDGAELARQYKLPDQVIDAILQHHGTTRVEYFFRMAMKNAETPEDVFEDQYTYPGPKPQYKEMGIIMLADSAESATRSLKNPTPGKIRSTIENIVKNKMEMGQLDESGLTLTEISQVIETFTRVINNIHHHRIEYPDDPRKTAEKTSDNDNAKTPVSTS